MTARNGRGEGVPMAVVARFAMAGDLRTVVAFANRPWIEPSGLRQQTPPFIADLRKPAGATTRRLFVLSGIPLRRDDLVPDAAGDDDHRLAQGQRLGQLGMFRQ